MFHILLTAFAMAQAAEGVTGKAKGFLAVMAMKGLVFAGSHPVYTGLIGGVAGMLIVFVLRKALWAIGKWVVGIPTAALSVAFRPVRALWRKFRHGRTARMQRLPLIGETATVGPCKECGTRREYRIKATAYYGGSLRGYDTVTGTPVLGCPDCSRC